MIIKTIKIRKDLSEEIRLYSNVVKIERCYDMTNENGVVLDMLNFTTNYQSDMTNGLYIDSFDIIYILNDEGKKIHTFVPLKKIKNKNIDGSFRTTSASKDESGEVNK